MKLTGLLTAIVIRDEVGLPLDKVGREVPGHDAKILLTEENATIIRDGSTQEAMLESKQQELSRHLKEISHRNDKVKYFIKTS